jgi:two-component system chemotaxis response regulator CheV
MIVTEYNGHTQGFLVESVDTILRLDWSADARSARHADRQSRRPRDGGDRTADNRLVMMLDVEKILSETAASTTTLLFKDIEPLDRRCHRLLLR